MDWHGLKPKERKKEKIFGYAAMGHLSLLFDRHLTLYAAIAAYKVAANPFPNV